MFQLISLPNRRCKIVNFASFLTRNPIESSPEPLLSFLRQKLFNRVYLANAQPASNPRSQQVDDDEGCTGIIFRTNANTNVITVVYRKLNLMG